MLDYFFCLCYYNFRPRGNPKPNRGISSIAWKTWFFKSNTPDVSRCAETQNLNGGLAQLVEHLLCTQGVRSSSLLFSTILYKSLQGSFLMHFYIFWHLICIKYYCFMNTNVVYQGFWEKVSRVWHASRKVFDKKYLLLKRFWKMREI